MKIKKRIVALIAVILMCAIAGCSSNSTSSGENAQANSEANEITIYFARHGKTMLNTVDRSQGWIDAPLTPVGVEVAEYLGKGLVDVEFDKVYSSDSGRAIETAELVLANNGQADLEIAKDKRLREYNFGTYEGMMNEEMWEVVAEKMGMTLDEFKASNEEDGMAAFLEDFSNALAELDEENVEDGVNWAGEDYDTIVARLTEALDEIVKEAEKNGDDTILVVSHGMSIITLLAELDSSAELPANGLSNASISTIVYKDGAYSVTAVNDMSYVEAGEGK